MKKKMIKYLASIKLAVVIILAMGTMSAWGTIVESIYNDARRAQELVYHSWYSYTIFVLLAVNLIAVIVDRYPWKKKHIGFISAHIGILILIMGSILTRYYGIDGSMAFNIGEARDRVMVQETDIVVYSGLSSGGARKVFEEEVNFLKKPPTEKKPFKISVGNDEIIVDRFEPYTLPQSKVLESDKEADGPGLRFQMSNERVSESEWIVLGGRPLQVKPLGPAQIVLAKKGHYSYTGGNILLLEYEKASEKLDYTVFTSSKNGKTRVGKVQAGESIETGWMGLTFRILKYLPKATETWEYTPIERSGEGVTSAIRFKFKGKEYWASLNSSMRLFSDDAYFIFIFANRQLTLDFSLKLNEFRLGRYQGTMRAATYESDVQVQEGEALGDKVTISMNEPLKYKGFTFYQSSFQQDEMGQPTMSILSVNRDPGRPWKYLGSLFIVFGIIHLFYFKRKGRA